MMKTIKLGVTIFVLGLTAVAICQRSALAETENERAYAHCMRDPHCKSFQLQYERGNDVCQRGSIEECKAAKARYYKRIDGDPSSVWSQIDRDEKYCKKHPFESPRCDFVNAPNSPSKSGRG